jgi:hypothetical protein
LEKKITQSIKDSLNGQIGQISNFTKGETIAFKKIWESLAESAKI